MLEASAQTRMACNKRKLEAGTGGMKFCGEAILGTWRYGDLRLRRKVSISMYQCCHHQSQALSKAASVSNWRLSKPSVINQPVSSYASSVCWNNLKCQRNVTALAAGDRVGACKPSRTLSSEALLSKCVCAWVASCYEKWWPETFGSGLRCGCEAGGIGEIMQIKINCAAWRI